MPRKTDTIAIRDPFINRRIKLIPCQKYMVKWWYEHGLSITKIAKLFHVNKRTIQFILFPERLKHNIELRNDRGGSKIYYKKERHTKAIWDHRQHKKEVFGKVMELKELKAMLKTPGKEREAIQFMLNKRNAFHREIDKKLATTLFLAAIAIKYWEAARKIMQRYEVDRWTMLNEPLLKSQGIPDDIWDYIIELKFSALDSI